MAQKIIIAEMYIDYGRGLSQREMERKYNLSYSVICRYCKKINKAMYNDRESFVSQNTDKIIVDINKIARLLFKNRTAWRENED